MLACLHRVGSRSRGSDDHDLAAARARARDLSATGAADSDCADADRSCPDADAPVADADASGTHADLARADADGFSARRVGADVAVGARPRPSYFVARKCFRRFGYPRRGAARLGRHGPWRRFWLVRGRG